MSAIASQITNVSIIYSTFVQAQIKKNTKAPRNWPLWGEFTGDFPHKEPVTRKIFPFDDFVMFCPCTVLYCKYFISLMKSTIVLM